MCALFPNPNATPNLGKKSSTALQEAGIAYTHLAKLGGLRHTTKGSINTGWHNLSFRGYADYMATEPFHEGLRELEILAQQKTVAIMCAEAVPWRCIAPSLPTPSPFRAGTSWISRAR